MAKAMRKVRTGSVVRSKQDKTAIVEMVWKQRHRLYHKQVRRVARFYVHDPENQCRLGDLVRIEETRPISKTKHWRLLEILERRQVAEVRPIDLESDVAPVLAPTPVVAEVEPPEPEPEEEVAAVEDAVEDDPEEEPAEEPEDSLEEEAEEEEPEEEPEAEEPEEEPAEEAEDSVEEEPEEEAAEEPEEEPAEEPED